jgi:hypothetical protein
VYEEKEKKWGVGTKEARKKANKGAKNQIISTKTQMVGRKKKKKKKVFTRWQLNSLALVKFAWPCWMVIKVDLVATKFYRHH